MIPAVIDFESYYDKEISVVTQGNVNYMRDADAYIVAATVGDEILCGTISEMEPTLKQLINDPNIQCWAANANFDEGWSDKYYGPSFRHWKCLLDLAAFHQLPRNLAGLSRAALGKEMDKTTRDQMRGVRYEDLTPERQMEVQLYCMEDVRRSKELLDFLPPMSPTEDLVAEHTRMMNRRGVYIDVPRVDRDKEVLERMKFNAFKSIPWHADSKPLSYPALKRWCQFNNIPVPASTAKTDEDCSTLMSNHPALAEVLESMRRFRKANTLIEKIAMLKGRLTDAGVLPLDNLYCGAPHTRRWSAKAFNNQNLDKKPTIIAGEELLGEQPADKLTSLLNRNEEIPDGVDYIWSRQWIIPPPGKMFLILDYAQVEPRCLNWLVGNEEMMEALRHGFSYYEAYATFARGWKGAPGTIKKEYGVQKYTLLKNECLGLGYGMGVDRFIDYAAENGNTITAEEATPVVKGFRANNQKIVKFWGKLDNLITSAARDKSRNLCMVMPTGDTLQYFSVRAKKKGYEGFTTKGDFSYQEGKCQGSLWGGTLTENVTQRMARDILAEGVLHLEAAGFPVMFHAHDEVILAVDYTEDSGKRAEILHEAETIMKQAPEWCAGLPLGCEGNFSNCYTKF